MSLGDAAPQALEIPKERPKPWRFWAWAGVIVGFLGLALWVSGVRPPRVWSATRSTLETVEIGRGEVALVVTENGTLESADNAVVRCKVEALIGTTASMGAAGSSRGGTSGSQGGSGGSSGSSGGMQGGGTSTTTTAAASSGAAARKSGAAAKAGGAKAKATGAGVASKSATPAKGATSMAGGTGAAGTGGTGTDASGSSSGVKRPDIQSFNYIVEPHVPLRGTTPSPSAAADLAKKQQQQQQQQQSSSSRGSSRGGRSGPGGSSTEMPGSTRIISILPEGTRVKKGDVVCELDASAFKDELQAQRIRYIQAKSWVEQAKSILEVNEIAMREFRDGIFPQDVQLIRQYTSTCRTEEDRARRNLVWARDTAKKGYRSNAQVQADALAYEQARIALNDAIGMEKRLLLYTAPRINKAREAKIEAIKADLASQESTFQLESTRLKKLEETIEYCTMRAPRDGIVVYASQPNRFGTIENPIQEGATVRESQPIFYVPDPRHMRVKARINESKLRLVNSGQNVWIRIDAFPNRPLLGTVGDITPIPAPASVSSLDVQIYYATVSIESGGFDELRPGLSAEVDFLVDRHSQVTRIPIQAIRWAADKPYAARTRTNSEGKTTWEWTALSLGLSDSSYAEVLSGLEPGDRVVAQAAALPAPNPRIVNTASTGSPSARKS